MSELVIDESNFAQYFRDCRMHRPERGDVMARYIAVAEFVDGAMKKDIIELLLNHEKALAATRVLRKLGCAKERDAIRICREIAEDLANGMNKEEVENKPYEYELEAFYYTKKEYVPVDDPHWSIISLNNIDQFLDKEKKVQMSAKFVRNEHPSQDNVSDEAQV
jgi:hypothetical protein